MMITLMMVVKFSDVGGGGCMDDGGGQVMMGR